MKMVVETNELVKPYTVKVRRSRGVKWWHKNRLFVAIYDIEGDYKCGCFCRTLRGAAKSITDFYVEHEWEFKIEMEYSPYRGKTECAHVFLPSQLRKMWGVNSRSVYSDGEITEAGRKRTLLWRAKRVIKKGRRLLFRNIYFDLKNLYKKGRVSDPDTTLYLNGLGEPTR